MPKQRVYELAKDLGCDKQELVSKINSLDLDISVGNYMSVLSPEEVTKVKKAVDLRDGSKKKPKKAKKPRSRPSSEDGVGPKMLRRRKPKKNGEDEDSEAATGPTLRRRKVTPSEEEPEVEEVAEEVTEETDEAAETPEPPAEEPEEEQAEQESAQEASDDGDDEAQAEESESEEAEAQDDAEAEVAEDAEEAEEAEDAEDAEDADEPQEADEAAASEEDEESDADDEPVSEEETEDADGEADAEEAEESSEEDASDEQQPPPEAKPKAPSAKRPKKRSKKKEKGDAKVVGRINEQLLKERLAAEDKDFSPGPSKSRKKKKKKGKGSSHRRKRVVEGSDLYDAKSRRKRRRKNKKKRSRPQKTEITEAAEHKRVIRIEDVISVGDLAHEMGVKAGKVAMELMNMGMMATVNTTLDFETAALIADEFDYSVENVAFDISNFYDTAEDPEETQVPRPPVVTVMGHVDHGKTSLLDEIRRTAVTDVEAGGITQHIGAYRVKKDELDITFLDTPGHEAFTALRMRGAKATDIAVLVVAADDGVMPQTVESINHARDAGVPMVVAINKIDKPQANPDRVKTALAEYELIPEEWGGTTLFVEVSALKGINIEGLLEALVLQAELEELKANPDRKAQGLVVEAELDIGRGPVSNVLVQRGTLRRGDIIVSGQYYGRVRTMHDDLGVEIEEAGPSEPVEITGLSGIPEAGEPIFVVEEESDAKRITEHVVEQRRKETMASRAKEAAGSLEDLSQMIREGEMKELKVIIKGDVQGSVEALRQAFGKLGNEEARPKIIHTGVGGITENDVNLAASSETGSVIVGFNVRPDSRASEVADEYGVQIMTHTIIYDAISQIRDILEGLLDPIVEEEVIGHAEVRETFSAPKVGTIAGCYVTDGKVRRNAAARILRQGQIIYDSTIDSLRRFQDDVREVKSGFECGLSIANYNDIKVGDVIEVYDHKEVAATL